MRYTALEAICDQAEWGVQKESLGTNFLEIGKGITPNNYGLKKHAPWIDMVTGEWEHFFGKTQTRDNDGWLRIHQASIYVEPSSISGKRRLVVYGFDVRSESRD